jgi:hypothetical protein
MNVNDLVQPSRPDRPLRFRIGRNSHGNWVVQDPNGLRGGLFVDRAEALRYALRESGNRRRAVIMVPGILELDITGTGTPGSALAIAPPPRRRVA